MHKRREEHHRIMAIIKLAFEDNDEVVEVLAVHSIEMEFAGRSRRLTPAEAVAIARALLEAAKALEDTNNKEAK
jgi:hypothetical protein